MSPSHPVTRSLPSLPLFPWLAVMCGAIASGRLARSGADGLNLLTLAALAACWQALWWALMDTDWPALWREQKAWRGGQPIFEIPYAEAGSLAERTAQGLGQAADWARRELFNRIGGMPLGAGAALALAFLLSARLGASAFAINLIAIAAIAIAFFLRMGQRDGGGLGVSFARAGIFITLPMLAGAALFGPVSLSLAALAAGLGMAYAGRGASWFHLGYALALAVLLFMRHTLGGFLIALFWLPHFLMALEPSAPQAARARSLWLAATMLVCAIALT